MSIDICFACGGKGCWKETVRYDYDRKQREYILEKVCCHTCNGTGYITYPFRKKCWTSEIVAKEEGNNYEQSKRSSRKNEGKVSQGDTLF